MTNLFLVDPANQHYLHPLETEKHIQMVWEQERAAVDRFFASLIQQGMIGNLIIIATRN